VATRAASGASGEGKRINMKDYTEKAWQAIVQSPELAREAQNQIVETEHLMKALLEQPNGLARRIISKAGGDPSDILEKVNNYIARQPRVSGDSGQVRRPGPRTLVHLDSRKVPSAGVSGTHSGREGLRGLQGEGLQGERVVKDKGSSRKEGLQGERVFKDRGSSRIEGLQ
jgi:ATP-dependent Clp protease ATP-binding subunit ClpA